MRLTTKGRFAVTAMVDLAHAPEPRPGDARRDQRAPAHFAFLPRAAVRQAAPRARWCRACAAPAAATTSRSRRRRSRSPTSSRAVDEPLDATQCGGKENCHDDKRCMTHDLWATLNEKMYEYLSSVTLADLVAHQSGKPVSVIKDFRHEPADDGEGRCMRLPIYLDYSATTPVDPRVAREDDPVPHRALRQRGEPLARVRLEGGGGGRGGARARRGADQRRPEGDRLDLGRDRRQQPRDQGRGELLQDQGQAHHHAEDRAQGGARHLPRARAPGLRGRPTSTSSRTASSTWRSSRRRSARTPSSSRS